MNSNQFLILVILTIICFNINSLVSSFVDQNSVINLNGENEEGIWGPIIEQWTTKNHSNRERRVMQLFSNSNKFSIIEDKTETNEKESKISSNVGKIISAPTTSMEQVTKKPARQVSETDLYLLGAIEKLAYKVDFMEKRLRRMEEMLYYVMAGNRVDQEPCSDNFSRVGANCYLFSASAGREFDWKGASKQCKKVGAVLSEMETIEENQDIVNFIQNNEILRGKDFWTGGLNPGLLWIWSNSARPVSGNKKNSSDPISGEGRCLRLAFDPRLRSYLYRGTDCSARHNYICELPETSSSNEIRRLGRAKKILNE